MYDRQPTYPGRVKLRDVETGLEKLYYLIMADDPTVSGDPPTKATMLTDFVAALYGKGPDARPTELFEILSKATIVAEGGFSLPDGSALPLSRVQSGSYTGTGKKGSANKNSITATFEVKMLFVGRKRALSDTLIITTPWVIGQTSVASVYNSAPSSSTSRLTDASAVVSWEGNTVKWHSTEGPEAQLNESGVEYEWVAFG